jgi:alkylated DNA repair dioxygenase AlkB
MESLNKYKLPFKRADVYYVHEYFPKEMADDYMEKLMKSIKLEKKEHEGRMTALHGSAKKYRYALNDSVPEPWTQELLSMKTKIETDVPTCNYDVCLLNYYASGKEKFNFHSDKEEIGNDIPIASISFGAERKFYFRSTVDDEQHCIVLGHGSLLIMGKGTHENYVHGLPADRKVKFPRLNLTFRKTRAINNPSLAEIKTPIVNKTTVVNKTTTKDYDVYIGRPGKWGNPFKMKSEDDRDIVIEKYKEWIVKQPNLLKDLHELKGKRLACYCKPKKCHGDILAELADKCDSKNTDQKI